MKGIHHNDLSVGDEVIVILAGNVVVKDSVLAVSNHSRLSSTVILKNNGPIFASIKDIHEVVFHDNPETRTYFLLKGVKIEEQ